MNIRPSTIRPSGIRPSSIRRVRTTALLVELVAADGTTYVMQTWSQQVDPTLSEADLARLGDRLQLPEGWTYRTRRLRAPLRVVTTAAPAHVLQDDLMNSYSQETG